jgi:hypothetical protein
MFDFVLETKEQQHINLKNFQLLNGTSLPNRDPLLEGVPLFNRIPPLNRAKLLNGAKLFNRATLLNRAPPDFTLVKSCCVTSRCNGL